MKLRLSGPPDIVHKWGEELKKSYGIACAEYPDRRGGNEIRLYCDVDDRLAAILVGLGDAWGAGEPKPAAGRKQIRGKK